jgi:hypothetical protein
MLKKFSFLYGLIFSTIVAFSQETNSVSTINQSVAGDSTKVTDNLSDTTQSKFMVPIFSTTGADADSEMDQQDASALLQASRDAFTGFASFHFGLARFRMRGFSAENSLVMINGINVNNLETGFSVWSSWGGLNDVTRYVENRIGIMPCRTGFSGIGGYTNIDSKSSSFRKGTRISYANSSRIFRHRGMVTHSTGTMENGWALTLSASTRQGNEVYIPGSYFNANAFYLSVDKRINDKNLFSLTSFYSPIEQGRSSSEIQEAYDLAGTNYYNSNWGKQDGKVRNSSIAKTDRPTFMLSHIADFNTTTKLTTSVFYSFGKNSLSGLNWNDAPNPRPTYYRYLPSWGYGINDQTQGDTQKNLWATDENTRQINWDKLIAANQANLQNLPGDNSINTTEKKSRYILENRVQNQRNLALNIIFNKRIDNLFISAGLNGNYYSNNYYKTVEDLLGGTFWLDTDQFAENQGVSENFASNNLDNPNAPIREGDKFGYDYNININRGELWGQAEYSINKFDLYVALSGSGNQIYRDSKVANGKFPETSKGEGVKKNFINYGIKGGATYKISGRQFVTLNGTFLTRTPEVNGVYISAQTRSEFVNGVTNEQVMGMDVNYLIKYPTFKVRATYYNSQVNNQVVARQYFHDFYNNFVNYLMTDVDQNFQGIELGVEKSFLVSHNVQAALGIGNNIYTNRPLASAIKSNSSENLFTDRTVYLKNYRVGGSPQTVAGLGYRYVGKKFWSAGTSISFFDDIYLEPNPDRRTAEALEKYTETDPQYAQIVDQERLKSNFTMDLNASKSFLFQRKYRLLFNLSVMNLLNNKNFRTSGSEQLRWDQTAPDRFPNRYNYALGITYMATVNFSF